MELNERTLSNNKIKQFILKIDFVSNDVNDFASIVNNISMHFSRLEQRMHINYNINLNQDELEKQQTPDYVLIDEGKAMLLTFSTFHNALTIESSKYINNNDYKEILKIVNEAIIKLGLPIQCKRIGIRFINNFQCKTMKDVHKIFNKDKAKNITSICQKNKISRVIIQEEYNLEYSKLRSQYGIPNKFYPSVMTTYDLLLDIDSFDDSTHSFEEWNEVIKNLNHIAYDEFIETMNPKYIESLK